MAFMSRRKAMGPPFAGEGLGGSTPGGGSETFQPSPAAPINAHFDEWTPLFLANNGEIWAHTPFGKVQLYQRVNLQPIEYME